jgi:hypothetical protein
MRSVVLTLCLFLGFAAPATAGNEDRPARVDCASMALIFSVLIQEEGLDVGISAETLDAMANVWMQASIDEGEVKDNDELMEKVLSNSAVYFEELFSDDGANAEGLIDESIEAFGECLN